jgi:broad specificity phosphatase PhoE
MRKEDSVHNSVSFAQRALAIKGKPSRMTPHYEQPRKEWYFIRHGQTDYNKQGIIQGSGIDSELNADGLRQAHAFYQAHQHVAFDLIITSALQRTRQTVHHFARKGIPILRDPSINEMHWGKYEGRPASEMMQAAYKQMVAHWQSGNFEIGAEDGETMAKLSTRLGGFLERLKKQEAQRVLICSHGRSLRVLMALARDGDLTKMEQNKHENTGLYKVVYHQGFIQFELENDTSHLQDLWTK